LGVRSLWPSHSDIGTPVPMSEWDGHEERTPNSPTSRIAQRFQTVRLNGSGPINVWGANLKSTFYSSKEDYDIRTAADQAPYARYKNLIAGNDTNLSFSSGLLFGGSWERDERDSMGQDPHQITNVGLYTQDKFKWSRLTFIPALRYDHHSAFGSQVNPRLTFLFNPGDKTQFSLGAARSFRAPQIRDLYDNFLTPGFPQFDFYGNPNLKPETSWTYDAGMKLDWERGGKLDMAAYKSVIKNRIAAIDTDNNGYTDTLTNAPQAKLLGLETTYSLQTAFLQHQLTYTLEKAEGNSVTDSTFIPLRYTPRSIGTYRVDAALPFRIGLTNSFHYVSEQFDQDGEKGVRLPSYLLWNVRMRKNFSQFSLYGGIDNLTNKRYADSATFGNAAPQPTRLAWVGVEMTFSKGDKR
jgi:outer membrane receptor protein involved in Fe transport